MIYRPSFFGFARGSPVRFGGSASRAGPVTPAAPDVDLSMFKQQIRRLDPWRFAVYVSKDDRDLQVLASLHGWRQDHAPPQATY
jgi:esterase/lipase superfamily enzyme